MRQPYFPSGHQTGGNVIDHNTSQWTHVACRALFMYFSFANMARRNDLYIKFKNRKQLPQVVSLNKEHSIFAFCILLQGNWSPKSFSITLTVNSIRINWHLFVVASIPTDNRGFTLSIYVTIWVLYATIATSQVLNQVVFKANSACRMKSNCLWWAGMKIFFYYWTRSNITIHAIILHLLSLRKLLIPMFYFVTWIYILDKQVNSRFR